jgi:LysR family glycine cleavage system transcriptional activator
MATPKRRRTRSTNDLFSRSPFSLAKLIGVISAALHHFRAFEAVGRLGSLRRAADELHVTPGAVSQQLRKLQDDLGVALLEKDGRRLRLTDAGRQLMAASGVALGELTGCLNGLATRAAGRDRRRMVLSVPLSLGVSWLLPRLFGFLELAGIAELDLRHATGAADVDWRGVDAALVYDNPPFPGFWWEKLSDVQLRPVMSPRLLQAGGFENADAFTRQRLLHEDDGSEWRRWLNAARVSRAADRNAHFDSLVMVLAAAEAGDGVALVSDFVTHEAVRTGRLVAPQLLSIPASRGYYLLGPDARTHDPLLRRFAAWLRDLGPTK